MILKRAYVNKKSCQVATVQFYDYEMTELQNLIEVAIAGQLNEFWQIRQGVDFVKLLNEIRAKAKTKWRLKKIDN